MPNLRIDVYSETFTPENRARGANLCRPSVVIHRHNPPKRFPLSVYTYPLCHAPAPKKPVAPSSASPPSAKTIETITSSSSQRNLWFRSSLKCIGRAGQQTGPIESTPMAANPIVRDCPQLLELRAEVVIEKSASKRTRAANARK